MNGRLMNSVMNTLALLALRHKIKVTVGQAQVQPNEPPSYPSVGVPLVT